MRFPQSEPLPGLLARFVDLVLFQAMFSADNGVSNAPGSSSRLQCHETWSSDVQRSAFASFCSPSHPAQTTLIGLQSLASSLSEQACSTGSVRIEPVTSKRSPLEWEVKQVMASYAIHLPEPPEMQCKNLFRRSPFLSRLDERSEFLSILAPWVRLRLGCVMNSMLRPF